MLNECPQNINLLTSDDLLSNDRLEAIQFRGRA